MVGGDGMTVEDRKQRERWLRSAVLAGDESAWNAWYVDTFDPLERYVRWRCGGRTDWSDEIVQEVWLTAVRKIRDFDPDQGAFLDWLRGIAANQVRNHARRHSRRAMREADRSDVEAIAELVSTDDQPPLAAALEAISDRHEAVLRAKYLDGLSVAEIANRWNETPKGVESLLTRARQAFREVYQRLTRGA